MNDDELKARVAKLHIPPCDDAAQSTTLHRALGALGRSEEKAMRWTWRDWLWPSPPAWGALAAIWVVVFAREPSSPHRAEPFATMPSQSRNPFFAHAEYQELLRQFQQSPNAR